MSLRRWIFGAGCAAIVGTLALPGVAGDMELQGAGYTGTTSGAWTCGPSARVRYGGLGAQVRWSERVATPAHGRGGTVVAGGALEYEHVSITRPSPLDQCDAPPCPTVPPPDAVLPGLGAKLGYDWRYVGFQIGAQAWSAWGSAEDRHATVYALPELELRGGPEHLVWGVVGFGSPLVTTYRRWGLYTGAGATLGHNELFATLGWFRSGPSGLETGALRVDAAWALPAFGGVGPRLGASVSKADAPGSALDWEGSLGLVWHL